jgi:hypothetical protein
VEQLERRELLAADAFVGVYDQGQWRLDGDPPAQIAFGLPGDQPVMGDWNGDGQQTPGVFRDGVWVLDITGNGFDLGDRVLHFGLPGDRAVAGDWNGNGIDTVGIYRHGLWYFDRDGNGYDHAVDSVPVAFGLPGDIPVAGDWNGDGRDTPGVFRNGTWVLDLTGNGYDLGDPVLQFGLPGAQPVSGDWNGNGRDTPAVLQHGQWYFDLEGDGFSGEVGYPNSLGNGIAVAGSRPIQSAPLPRGTVLNESISRVGEEDRFTFHGNSGENMQINVAIQPGSNLQLEVTVFKPNGSSKLGTRMVTTTSRIGFWINPHEAGTYTVQVKAREGTGMGNYRIGLQSLTVAHVGPAQWLNPNTQLVRHISGSAQSQQYILPSQPNRTLTIQIDNLAHHSGFRPRVTLYSEGGSIIRSIPISQPSGILSIRTTSLQGSRLLLHVEDEALMRTGQAYRLTYHLS